MIRLAEDFVILVQQHEVDAPSIRSDRDNPFAEFFPRECEPVLDFRPKAQNIPAQSAGQWHWAVWKTMNFFEPDRFAVPNSRHDAAAFRAQIDREINTVRHGFSSN